MKTKTYQYGSTEQFAALNQVKSQTVRKRLCEIGSYFGVVPRKLASRRLVWPLVWVEPGGEQNDAGETQ